MMESPMHQISKQQGFRLAALVLFVTGCQSTGLRLLNLMGLEPHPLSVALVADRPTDAVQAVNPFAAFKPLQAALADELGRPVAVDVCFSFQVESGFATGWYDLAVVTPTQFARLKDPAAVRTLCVAVDRQGRTARSALLVVPAESQVQSVQDLRGRVVAFGPAEDGITHHGAVQYLRSQGLWPEDLALDLLPIPGSLRHYADGRATADALLSGSAAAGFIDEADWQDLPETGDGAPRDQLRIVARTPALPIKLLIASPRLDPATADAVRDFALRVGTTRPDALAGLPISGYQEPDDALVQACRTLNPPTERCPVVHDEERPTFAVDEQPAPRVP
jgi:ABC-type phosphate/phosphonate transport system substrate-binding protein